MILLFDLIQNNTTGGRYTPVITPFLDLGGNPHYLRISVNEANAETPIKDLVSVKMNTKGTRHTVTICGEDYAVDNLILHERGNIFNVYVEQVGGSSLEFYTTCPLLTYAYALLSRDIMKSQRNSSNAQYNDRAVARITSTITSLEGIGLAASLALTNISAVVCNPSNRIISYIASVSMLRKFFNTPSYPIKSHSSNGYVLDNRNELAINNIRNNYKDKLNMVTFEGDLSSVRNTFEQIQNDTFNNLVYLHNITSNTSIVRSNNILSYLVSNRKSLDLAITDLFCFDVVESVMDFKEIQVEKAWIRARLYELSKDNDINKVSLRNQLRSVATLLKEYHYQYAAGYISNILSPVSDSDSYFVKSSDLANIINSPDPRYFDSRFLTGSFDTSAAKSQLVELYTALMLIYCEGSYTSYDNSGNLVANLDFNKSGVPLVFNGLIRI